MGLSRKSACCAAVPVPCMQTLECARICTDAQMTQHFLKIFGYLVGAHPTTSNKKNFSNIAVQLCSSASTPVLFVR